MLASHQICEPNSSTPIVGNTNWKTFALVVGIDILMIWKSRNVSENADINKKLINNVAMSITQKPKVLDFDFVIYTVSD